MCPRRKLDPIVTNIVLGKGEAIAQPRRLRSPICLMPSASVSNALVWTRAQVMPSMNGPEFVAAGGLMSYSSNVRTRLVGSGIIPVASSRVRTRGLAGLSGDQVDLVINMPAARVLGLDVPPRLLAPADEVIE